MVLTALRHAEANLLQKRDAAGGDMLQHKTAADKHGLTSSDVAAAPRLVSARQTVSDESRQLVSAAIDQAQGAVYLQQGHQCTFDAHSSSRQSAHQLRHPITAMTGRLSLSTVDCTG